MENSTDLWCSSLGCKLRASNAEELFRWTSLMKSREISGRTDEVLLFLKRLLESCDFGGSEYTFGTDIIEDCCLNDSIEDIVLMKLSASSFEDNVDEAEESIRTIHIGRQNGNKNRIVNEVGLRGKKFYGDTFFLLNFEQR